MDMRRILPPDLLISLFVGAGSPSRSALLSGRLPIHVNIYNDDPARPGAGVPVGMTMISEKLAGAGYMTHFIGKVCLTSVACCCNLRHYIVAVFDL